MGNKRASTSTFSGNTREIKLQFWEAKTNHLSITLLQIISSKSYAGAFDYTDKLQ